MTLSHFRYFLSGIILKKSFAMLFSKLIRWKAWHDLASFFFGSGIKTVSSQLLRIVLEWLGIVSQDRQFRDPEVQLVFRLSPQLYCFSVHEQGIFQVRLQYWGTLIVVSIQCGGFPGVIEELSRIILSHYQLSFWACNQFAIHIS